MTDKKFLSVVRVLHDNNDPHGYANTEFHFIFDSQHLLLLLVTRVYFQGGTQLKILLSIDLYYFSFFTVPSLYINQKVSVGGC